MTKNLTRRSFISATAIGAASLVLPCSTAFADPESPSNTLLGANDDWMRSEAAASFFSEIKGQFPDLEDWQIRQSVYTKLDPYGLAGREGNEPDGLIALLASSGSAAALVNEARIHISWTSGVSSNQFCRWYYGYDCRVEWCDIFVSYCAAMSGSGGTVGRYAYVPNHANYFRSRGQWTPRGANVRAGDIIFFDWDRDGEYDHVGIVEWCDGVTVGTIEGNTGVVPPGSVLRRQYGTGNTVIAGYGRPTYALDMEGSSIQLYDLTGVDAQKWIITQNADGMVGKCVLQNKACLKYLDVHNSQTADRTPVKVQYGNGNLAQKWSLEVVDNGTNSLDRVIVLRSALNDDKVLDCVNGGRANGTGLDLFTYNGTVAQQWSFVWAGEPNTYYIVNLVSGKCLDVVNGGT